jgi:hypothetical protein
MGATSSLCESAAAISPVRFWPISLFTKLQRKWPAYNLSGDRYPEIIVAIDALNRLVAHLCAASAGGNMNFLLGFTVFTFNWHHDNTFVRHLVLRVADSTTVPAETTLFIAFITSMLIL